MTPTNNVSVFVIQQLIKEEWEALQKKEREEQEAKDREKRDKEVTFLITLIKSVLLNILKLLYYVRSIRT